MDSTTHKIRKEYSASVAQHSRRYTAVEGTTIVLGHLLSVLVAVVFSEVFFLENSFIFALAVVWIGTRQRALGNILHECAHSSFFESHKSNKVLGTLLGFLDFRSFREYKMTHMRHHRWLGVKGKDPDFLGAGFSLSRYVIGLLPKPISSCDPLMINALRLLFLLSIVVAAALNEWVLNYYLLPYFTSYMFCRVLSDFMDHGFLEGKQNEFEKSRNHSFRFSFLNWILFPRNDGFHLIHHLFPSAPARSFDKLHKMLRKSEIYSTRESRKFESANLTNPQQNS